MKKVNTIKIKDIMFEDKISAIEDIASEYFMVDSYGDVHYTPYFSEIAVVNAIVKYFLTGVEFEDGDTKQSIYNEALNNKYILKQIKRFFVNSSENAEEENENNKKYIEIMDSVMDNVKDKVKFTKQKLIHGQSLDALDKISLMCDKLTSLLSITDNVVSVMNKIAESDITPEAITKAIKDAVAFDMDSATEEIIDAKNEQIRELKKKLEDKNE